MHKSLPKGTLCKMPGQAHISCTCPREIKLPLKELAWLQAQREKTGDYSIMLMGKGDMVETERQVQYAKKKEQVEERPEKQRKIREKEIRLMTKKFEVPSEESEVTEAYPATLSKDVTETFKEDKVIYYHPAPFSKDVAEPNKEPGESVMLQFAAQWPEYRSQIQEEEEDWEYEELDQLSPLQFEEEYSLLTAEMVAHQTAGMNPVPPVTPSLTVYLEKGAKAKRQEVIKRNMLPIPHTARTSIRYELSSTETAAVASSFLLDLIEGGILPQELSYLTLDKCKVQRWRNQVMVQASETASTLTTDETIKGIFFDARKDKTLFNEKDPVTGRFHTRIRKDNHVSVTSEPDGKYRFHFKPEEAVAPYKPGYMEAKGLHEFWSPMVWTRPWKWLGETVPTLTLAGRVVP